MNANGSCRFHGSSAFVAISQQQLSSCQPDRPSSVTGPPSAGDLLSMASVPQRSAHGGDVPYWSDLSDSVVWAAGGKRDSVFMVGLEAPGASRGLWHGKRLVDAAATRGLRASLVQQFGLRLVWEDSVHFPQIEVHIPSLAAFSQIRRLPTGVSVTRSLPVSVYVDQNCGPYGC